MKKRIISALIAAPLLFSGVHADYDTATSSFAVISLVEQNVLQGDENGNLNLSFPVTRAEFAKLAITAFGIDIETDYINIFSDLTESHWAYKYILAAADNEIINGFEDGTVRPDDHITYEQAIKMAVMLEYPYELSYPDEYVGFAVDRMLLDNVNARMGEKMTRLDTVNLIYNTLQEREDLGEPEYDYMYSASKSRGAGRSVNMPMLSGALPEATHDSGAVIEIEGVGGYASSSSKSYAPLGGYISINPNTYFNNEEYASENENVFKSASLSPLSTFSADTDTASYSNMRRFIVSGQLPPNGSIRSEEIINYFDYNLPSPEDGTPFSVTTELAQCPWNDANKLAMISIKGEEISKTERKPQNLVFLVDVSGSMYSSNKLPLIKRSMSLLLDNLDERDTISLVTYASGTDVLLSGANASDREKIMNCINSLQAYGSTNGEAGLQLAYEQAEKFKTDGNNRIILCTDGDFNVGITSDGELKDVVTKKRENGIYLSILGFGMGNYKDSKMEIMADNGNGNYYYIDNLREAKKVLADEMTKTLYTIAKDVKFQVEFNPSEVKEYRLVGYENRALNNEDFDNDKKDAGEIGAGACVTVLYEIIPADGDEKTTGDSSLRYQTSTYSGSSELMNVSIRYKLPGETESILKEYPVENISSGSISKNLNFASAAAELGMILNKSEYIGNSTYDSVISLASDGMDEDRFGLKTEFIQLVDLLRYVDKYSSKADRYRFELEY